MNKIHEGLTTNAFGWHEAPTSLVSWASWRAEKRPSWLVS